MDAGVQCLNILPLPDCPGSPIFPKDCLLGCNRAQSIFREETETQVIEGQREQGELEFRVTRCHRVREGGSEVRTGPVG